MTDIIETALQILQDVKAGDSDYWGKLDCTIAGLERLVAQEPIECAYCRNMISIDSDHEQWCNKPNLGWKVRALAAEELNRKFMDSVNGPTHMGEPVIPSKAQAAAAFQELQTALQADVDYAWSWHCNLAMPIMDSIRCTPFEANKAAADLMQFLFKINVRKLEQWHRDEPTTDRCASPVAYSPVLPSTDTHQKSHIDPTQENGDWALNKVRAWSGELKASGFAFDSDEGKALVAERLTSFMKRGVASPVASEREGLTQAEITDIRRAAVLIRENSYPCPDKPHSNWALADRIEKIVATRTGSDK